METTAERAASGAEDGAKHSIGKRILIATFGSLGDLHPYMAIALELRRRGHVPTIATTENYRANVEAEEIGFAPMRPDVTPLLENPDLAAQLLDPKYGTERLIRDYAVPSLRDSYADLKRAAQSADLLITHPLAFAGPMLAEQMKLPWVSTILTPMSLLSAYDLPRFANAPVASALGSLHPAVGRLVISYGRGIVKKWSEPIQSFRAEIGLPPAADPLLEGQHSPDLALALFSPLMASPQPDWPAQMKQTGFPFYDQSDQRPLPPTLEAFLKSGPPPVVFTLGSAAVLSAGDFYAVSAVAAPRVNRRGVLLTGSDPKNRPENLPKNVIAVDYAPYSELFPRAAAVVHSGGIGTTAQCLRAGKPMLIVPFANDQFDNAHRIRVAGLGRRCYRNRYNILNVGAEICRLLNDPPFMKKTKAAGEAVRAENGTMNACDLIETYLASRAAN